MALKDILNKIQSIANQEVEKLQHDFEKKKLEVIARYDKETTELLAELDQKAEIAGQAVTRKVETMAHRDTKQAVLLTKRALLDKAMTEFMNSLVKLSDSEKEKMYTKLASGISPDNGEVKVAKGEKSLVEKVLGTSLTVQEDETLKGGFIIFANGAETDCSFENLLNSEYKSELEMYLSEQLKLV